MKLKRSTILELGKILKDEFKLQLNKQDLERLAYCLIGYFDLLLKVKFRQEVQK
jgi:hypothetical protein